MIPRLQVWEMERSMVMILYGVASMDRNRGRQKWMILSKFEYDDFELSLKSNWSNIFYTAENVTLEILSIDIAMGKI